MRLLAVGGGSGGHVTPVRAIVNQLSSQIGNDNLTVKFICDRSFEAQSRGIMEQADIDVDISVIMAGKFRRYHGDSWFDRLIDVRTAWLNLRDTVYIAIGLLQAIWQLRRFRPDVVFAKGGFVCLPVGIAAKLLKIPLVIHDSDVRPGLTNRVLSRFASAIATGAPLKYYSYPKGITYYTGVPIDDIYRPVEPEQVLAAKQAIGVDRDRPLIVVTGGGLGAVAINLATVKAADRLVKQGYSIYHVTGKKHYDSVKQAMVGSPHYQAVEFVYKDMATVLSAADLVVSRASATFLQELAGLAKPVLAIPARQLGDQQKNATVFAEADAVEILQDVDIARGDQYYDSLSRLMSDSTRRQQLSANLHNFAKPQATSEVAQLIIDHQKSDPGAVDAR